VIKRNTKSTTVFNTVKAVLYMNDRTDMIEFKSETKMVIHPIPVFLVRSSMLKSHDRKIAIGAKSDHLSNSMYCQTFPHAVEMDAVPSSIAFTVDASVM